MPVAKQAYIGSPKALQSIKGAFVLLIRLGFSKKFAGIMLPMTTNPQTLIVQPYPNFGSNDCKIAEKIRPPKEFPIALIARARLRRLVK
jgi:hypothetical protein